MGTPVVIGERVVRNPLVRAVGALEARRATIVALAPVAAAGALWALALPHVDASQVSGYGLLAGLPATYYAALVVLAAGFALCVSAERPRAGIAAAYVGTLVVVVHATAAIVFPEPRYTWTYKHVGVIDYLAAHGAADRSVDIYNNWPGFFGLSAWLEKTAGIDPLAAAAWAQPVFELAFAAAVVFAMRGVTRDVRLIWSAAWLFIVANWIGQDYLAPQAFTFLLALVFLGIVIRSAPWARPPRTRAMWAAVRLSNRIGAALLRGRSLLPQEAAAARIPAPAALLMGGVLYFAVVISHQLSPIMLLASVGVLLAATRRPPAWVLLAMAAVEVWWVWLGSDFVTAHFKLLDFDPAVTARTGLGTGLPGVKLGADLSRAGIVLMAALAVAGLLRRLRGRRLDAIPLALAIAPLFVTLFQSYGGEGPLRVYLFALPWLAFFVAAACAPSSRARTPLGRAWPLLAVTLVVGTATLFGYFGQDTTNYMTGDDVAVSRWYLDHTPREASVTLLAPNFPDRLDANYANHLTEPRSLFGTPDIRRSVLVPERLPVCRPICGLLAADALKRFLLADGARTHYVIVSPSQLRYARYYQLATPAQFARFTRALLHSPSFRLAYRHGGGYVFRYSGGTA